MAKSTEEKQLEILEQIKRLQILQLSHDGVEGKKIASILGVDAAVISRILSVAKGKK